jgi:hypothetical protein
MIKRILQKIKQTFKHKQPQYGANIFKSQSWLEREIAEELYKRHILLGTGLGRASISKRK